MQIIGKNTQRLLLALTVFITLAAAILAYWPGLHGPFLFDDMPNIIANTGIRITSLAPHELLRAAFSSRSGILYRPISMLSFTLNFFFFGENSFSFKLTNLIIHLINALLILWLTKRLLVNCRMRYQFGWHDRNINWASVLIAAAWALHPLNLTAVLYIVQRMTGLAALFTLAGILAYVHGRERMLARKTGWPLVWLLTPFFGVIGVLCKEDAALLPLYLLVIEWLIFGFRNRHQALSKNTVFFYLCGLVLPGIIGLSYLITHPQFFLANYAYRDFTLPERVFTEFRVVWLYIQWTFFPDIRQLALYHDDLSASIGLLTPLTTLWTLLAIIALLVIAWWQRKYRPLLSLGILFFFAGQAMESTILPLEIIFEHRNYLPDYGLLLAAFSLLLLPTTDSSRHARLSLRWAIAIIAIPVLFSVTFLRASEWRTFLDFGYYEAQHHPKSGRALYTLGQAYSNLALGGISQDSDIALAALSRAAAVSDNIIPDTAMMIVSSKMKLPVNPAWQKHAEAILQTYPVATQDTAALDALVNCLPSACKVLGPSANSLIQVALHSKDIEKLPRSQADLWVIYSNYLTFTDAPFGEILAAMQQSVHYEPNISVYRINLTKGLMIAGQFDAAESQIQQLSRMNKLGSLDLDIQSLKASLAATRAEAKKPKQVKP
ncbi:MAG TPA: hypothetical protein VNF46_01985 [Gammaproteobacteria bacterium]|nr:hypothetical protein [Gammaproteobacteria bacterium]